jgi:hypothetical protein
MCDLAPKRSGRTTYCGLHLRPAQGQSIIALLAATTRCAHGFIFSAYRYVRLSRGQGLQRGCGETSPLATEGTCNSNTPLLPIQQV